MEFGAWDGPPSRITRIGAFAAGSIDAAVTTEVPQFAPVDFVSPRLGGAGSGHPVDTRRDMARSEFNVIAERRAVDRLDFRLVCRQKSGRSQIGQSEYSSTTTSTSSDDLKQDSRR